MKIILLAALFGMGLCLLTGCTRSEPNDTATESPLPQATAPQAAYHRITAQEAKTMMDDGKAYSLLDVRTPSEYDAQRLEGAYLIPDNEILDRVEAELPEKNARILVYCRSGRRSALAAKAMVEMGYTQVYDFGGIMDWPYETVGQ